MTRFARACSKSMSKRIPDDATPWQQLNNVDQSVSQQPKQVSRKHQNKVSLDPLQPPDRNIETVFQNEKLRCNKELKRRKPLTDIPSIFKDGREVNIVRFEGFPVQEHDAKRLKELKKKLLAEKIPHAIIKERMKLERRRAEKTLAREKKKLCFHCRNSGHVLSECPNLAQNDDQLPESGICFKCGSTEHQHIQCKTVRNDSYKFAICFICNERGHISKQCPDNPRGMYPEGGSCRVCGDVTHLKKDCPKLTKQKQDQFVLTVNTLNTRTSDALDEDLRDINTKISVPPSKKKKIVKI